MSSMTSRILTSVNGIQMRSDFRAEKRSKNTQETQFLVCYMLSLKL